MQHFSGAFAELVKTSLFLWLLFSILDIGRSRQCVIAVLFLDLNAMCDCCPLFRFRSNMACLCEQVCEVRNAFQLLELASLRGNKERLYEKIKCPLNY